MPAVRSSGTLICLASATAFGAMAVFGKLAYAGGATVGTLLAVRFGLAASLFWAGGALADLRGIGRRDVVAPRALAALVCTGAALSLTLGSATLGELRPGAVTLAGWAWLACLAAVSTVAAISLLFAGMRRVGPTRASILSCGDAVVTALLSFAV